MVRGLDHSVDAAALAGRVHDALAEVHDPEIPPVWRREAKPSFRPVSSFQA